MDILEKLRNYNPPDRTAAGQRAIAEDIKAAADEIERLRGLLRESLVKFTFYRERGFVTAPSNLMKRLRDALRTDDASGGQGESHEGG